MGISGFGVMIRVLLAQDEMVWAPNISFRVLKLTSDGGWSPLGRPMYGTVYCVVVLPSTLWAETLVYEDSPLVGRAEAHETFAIFWMAVFLLTFPSYVLI